MRLLVGYKIILKLVTCHGPAATAFSKCPVVWDMPSHAYKKMPKCSTTVMPRS